MKQNYPNSLRVHLLQKICFLPFLTYLSLSISLKIIHISFARSATFFVVVCSPQVRKKIYKYWWNSLGMLKQFFVIFNQYLHFYHYTVLVKFSFLDLNWLMFLVTGAYYVSAKIKHENYTEILFPDIQVNIWHALKCLSKAFFLSIQC